MMSIYSPISPIASANDWNEYVWAHLFRDDRGSRAHDISENVIKNSVCTETKHCRKNPKYSTARIKAPVKPVQTL
jgi:hypothetical protein